LVEDELPLRSDDLINISAAAAPAATDSQISNNNNSGNYATLKTPLTTLPVTTNNSLNDTILWTDDDSKLTIV